jgi:hypothetical protein
VNTPEEFDYYWWTNAARNEIAALITQMGLQGCPVCASNEALGLLPWPGVVHIGGTEKPVGAPHREDLLFMALCPLRVLWLLDDVRQRETHRILEHWRSRRSFIRSRRLNDDALGL